MKEHLLLNKTQWTVEFQGPTAFSFSLPNSLRIASLITEYAYFRACWFLYHATAWVDAPSWAVFCIIIMMILCYILYVPVRDIRHTCLYYRYITYRIHNRGRRRRRYNYVGVVYRQFIVSGPNTDSATSIEGCYYPYTVPAVVQVWTAPHTYIKEGTGGEL